MVPREVSHRAQQEALIVASEVSNQGRRKGVKRDQVVLLPGPSMSPNSFGGQREAGKMIEGNF